MLKTILFYLLALVCSQLVVGQPSTGPTLQVATLPNGVQLHYLVAGQGEPLIFIHGSLSDYSYWLDAQGYFSKQYKTITYSRRFNFPNNNPPITGYSAAVDAEDLVALIKALNLKKVTLCGHSYGALTALLLAVNHPELVAKLIIAEPPAVSLLANLSGKHHAEGLAVKQDIETNLVSPMHQYFMEGKREQGVAVFINYVLANPHAWESFSAEDKAETLKDAHEWDVMMTTGVLFPVITPAQVQQIKIPVLMFTGDKSYHFLNLIDEELHNLLPDNQQVIFKNTGHQLWFQQPEVCKALVNNFLRCGN